ncbi:MAG: sulfatase-like hydrolase/transferase, partial [Opitutales bacterium]
MMETDDVPAFRFFIENLHFIAWGVTICSGLCLLACGVLFRRLSSSWAGLGLWVSMAMCGLLSGGDAIWALTDRSSFEVTAPESLLDWIRVLAFPATGCFFLTMMGGRNWEMDELIHRGSPWRYAIVFVLGASSTFVYALADHFAFWQPSLNGGHDYERFLAAGEITTANLVLYSTSLLFASMVGVIAIACRVTYRLFCLRESGWIGRFCPVQGRQTLVVAILWTLSLSCPWMLKLWPEIANEGVWILPVATTGFFFSCFVGPVGMTNKLIGRDELMKRQTPGPNGGGSERLFISTTLFLLYPALRFFPAKNPNRRRIWLLWTGAISAGIMAWLAHEADNMFSFEDWRGMLKKSQLPYLRIYGSVLVAFAIYLWCRRRWAAISLQESGKPKPFKKYVWWRRLTVTIVLLITLGGSWPLWGWGGVPENVFARTAEFSGRHRFELLVLHWLFDKDGDGYASVLHGADSDDSNPSLLAGGMAAVGPTFAEKDTFRVENPHSLGEFPSVVLLFLEGVTPEAVSAYGKRQLQGGIKTTPHIDQIASDGALFTNARVTYPSTWDTWYATLSGRMVRIMEMSSRWKLGDRYSRLNNLSEIMEKGGIERHCYPDATGFKKLFLTDDELRLNWQPAVDTALNSKDRLAGVKRGDKRLARMLDFIDDLQENDRFFLCEHMGDTHFPWSRTTVKKAKQLGFPNGLEFAEEGG